MHNPLLLYQLKQVATAIAEQLDGAYRLILESSDEEP
jgi:hypothetical protein